RLFFFFFQAEDGIRDFHVTGVQTCALPIFPPGKPPPVTWGFPGGTPQMVPHSLSPHRRYSSTFVSSLVQVKSDALQGVSARVRIHLFSNISPAALGATLYSRPETNTHHPRTSRNSKHRMRASGKDTS